MTVKLTPWFPFEIKPVRVGVYQCQECTAWRGNAEYHYWTGKEWRCDRNDIIGEATQKVTWRGLAEKPK